MYSKFSCDLTSNFTAVDLTSSFGSEDMTSADSTSTSTTSVIDNLRKQLEQATLDLNAQNKIYADSKTYWDACTWKNPLSKKKGYYHNDVYADGDCMAARDRMTAASTKVSQLTSQIKTLNESIDKVTASTVSTDPKLIQAKADADKVKSQADAAVRQSEVIGAATASKTKIIGYALAAVILIGGITWAIMKFRKK